MSDQANVMVLSRDNESIAKNVCVNSIHPNGNDTVFELSHSTDMAPSLCLTEKAASKADDQCSGDSCICQNAVSNDTIRETLLQIYDINYAGMEDKFITSVMHAFYKQIHSDFANITAPIFQKWHKSGGLHIWFCPSSRASNASEQRSH